MVDAAANNRDDDQSVSERVYSLPGLGVQEEFNRLDKQSRAVWELMGGRHSHSPMSDNASLILDVGCGTGAVAISMGLKYPGTEVIGIDLSAVPPTHVAPPNVMFLEGNIFDLAGKDPRLQPASADLVYARWVMAGIKKTDWPRYFRTLLTLAKPGGHVEVIENQMRFYRCTDVNDIIGTRYIHEMEWFDAWDQACAEGGIDLDAGPHLERHFRDAGLEDVAVKVYPFPNSPWIEKYMPEAGAMGRSDSSQAVKFHVGHVLQGRFSEEQVQRYKDDAERYCKGDPDQCFALTYAVHGKKPGG